ncbi:uncharacterized protein LOC126283677 [Schistocerca gregaria]|uniref:uncharacterized protein LOC126283677 n=1 Tax=Schistocerca gregaria TaxID=7010 RepID=UPI00211E58AF|nr:uncharacterized protein LOC126283677 [Schistocerca gregaria]
MPDRCVKCAGTHGGRACPRPPTEKPTCALCGGAHVASYRGCEVWKRAIAPQRGQTPAPRPKKPATRRPGVSFAASTSGMPSAVPAASAPPAPPPQLLVADPGTASPGTSAGPRPANRRRGGQFPWAPSAQHRQSSSPRCPLTAPQPRLPLPATGPRRLPPPLSWPTSSRNSLSW